MPALLALAAKWLLALLKSRTGQIILLLAVAYGAHQVDKGIAVRAAHKAGVDECEAAHREAVEKLNRQIELLADQTNAAAVDLIIAMQERDDLERRLEDEARTDPDLGVLGPDRLRRLDAIR